MQELLYPMNAKKENSDNPAIRIYGNRLHSDQSLYEYLIEFLLVFSSAKDVDGSGVLQFHQGEALHYYVKPRNGFRRFVFYEQARKTKKVPADESAYEDIKKVLLAHINAAKESEKNDFIYAVQDLFRGYAAVLKNRSWCAQSLLPLCPEMIFCEEMPNDRTRLRGPDSSFSVDPRFDLADTFYDASFDLKRHNFLARGGELYYLHLLQALENKPENRQRLQELLSNLLTDKSADFSRFANWIQSTWEKEKNLDPEKLVSEMNMGYIPKGSYSCAGMYAIEELTFFLANQLHPVKRIELLAKGIMLQILRMQVERTEEFLEIERTPWIVDMCGTANATIKQLSANSFNRVTELFSTAINKYIVDSRTAEDIDLSSEYKLYVKARKESVDVFKGKGKEIQCIIPSNGPFERFSMSEDIVKFLVLSIVPAGGKMDLDSFLEKLFEHYSFVIGPHEYKKCLDGENIAVELSNSFNVNKDAFHKFLKNAGFLRALSDATSIVVNPYKEVIIE